MGNYFCHLENPDAEGFSVSNGGTSVFIAVLCLAGHEIGLLEQIGEPELTRLSVCQRRFLRLGFLVCQRQFRWPANPVTSVVIVLRIRHGHCSILETNFRMA